MSRHQQMARRLVVSGLVIIGSLLSLCQAAPAQRMLGLEEATYSVASPIAMSRDGGVVRTVDRGAGNVAVSDDSSMTEMRRTARSRPASPRVEPAARAQPCAAPFGFSGERRTSTDPGDPVAYTLYRGHVTSWDGETRLAVDVTVPDGIACPMPLVAMFHGGLSDRTEYEKSCARCSTTAAGYIDWNNVAFAGRGYAVLTYTSRGKGVGPHASGGLPTNDDPRYEIRDSQFLMGSLVDQGLVDPDRIGVTGNSYGGGQAWWLALLNDRTVTALTQGADGYYVPTYAPWTSPLGRPLHIAASVPIATWSSYVGALLPNGRATVTRASDGPEKELNTPVGIPKDWAPPLVDDPTIGYERMYPFTNSTPVNPFFNDPDLDPLTWKVIRELDRVSPLYQSPDALVPILQIQGTTDALYDATQALQMRHHVLNFNDRYPITSYFADLGHSAADGGDAYAWAPAYQLGHRLFDHHLRGLGSPPPPHVTVVTQDCDNDGAAAADYRAPRWSALSRSSLVTRWSDVKSAASDVAPPSGTLVDRSPSCQRYDSPVLVDPWTFPVGDEPLTLVGTPTLQVSFESTASDVELIGLLWDVGSGAVGNMRLVGVGAYRWQPHLNDPAALLRPSSGTVTFELPGHAYRFEPGHTVALELVTNASPWLQANNIRSLTTFRPPPGSLPGTPSVTLTLPIRERLVPQRARQ